MSKRASGTNSYAGQSSELLLNRSGKPIRTGLLLGTALGCSIAVFSLSAPGSAWAANECGTPVNALGVDVAVCTAGNYPSGITYTDSGGNPVTVILDSGADPTNGTGVTVTNTASGAFANVNIQSGVLINAAGNGAAVYTTGGGNAYIFNNGTVFSANDGLYADAKNGGSVQILEDGAVYGQNNAIYGKTSDGNVVVYAAGLRQTGGINVPTTTALHAYAAGGHGTVIVGSGGLYLETAYSYAIGVHNQSSNGSATNVEGYLTVTGATGAIGAETTSASVATTSIEGDVTVTSGYHGTEGGNATGLITAGTYADVFVEGNVHVTALNGVAVGSKSVGAYGGEVAIEGNVSVTGDLGATGVYVRTIYNGTTLVYLDGDVSAYTGKGTATGVYARSGDTITNAGTDVVVTVQGNVRVGGYTEAIGVEAINSAGNIDVDVGKNVRAIATQGMAIGVETIQYGAYNNIVTVGGNVYAKGGTGAYGVMAEGGNIYVGITGDVTAIATAGNAVGVISYGDNTVHIGGNVNVTAAGKAQGVVVGGADGYGYVGGHVSAISTGAGYAEGFYGNATGNVGAHIKGSIYAASAGGTAIGVLAKSGGNIGVYVGGDIYAKAPAGAAAGVAAYALTGYATVTVDGSIVARGNQVAIGAAVVGYGDIHVGGDIAVYATGGNATGVEIASGGGYAFVGGNVKAVASGAGDYIASGFYGNVTGNVAGHIDGNIYVSSAGGTAVGMLGKSSAGNVSLYAGGDIYAKAPTGGAAGVAAYVPGGYATVTVEGSIVARGAQVAIGAAVVGYGNIHVGGDIGAYATGGNASGVEIAGGGGYAYVHGNVTAKASGGDYIASAFYANVTGNVSGHIDGNIYVESTGGTAVGMLGKSSAGNVSLYAGGDIYAKGLTGGAAGVAAYGPGYSTITVEGNIVAKGDQVAIGAAVVGYGNIHVSGDIGVVATGGNASGVEIASGGGYAFVGGNVTAMASGGDYIAAGFYGNVAGNVSAHIDGNIYVESTGGVAVGMLGKSSAGNISLYAGGDIYAKGLTGGAAGAAAYGPGYSTVTVEGNIVAKGEDVAIGAAVVGYGNIHVGGDIGVVASDGNATGVEIANGGGYAYVHGSVTAMASGAGYVAAGFYAANVTGAVNAHIDGNIYAEAANGTAVGMLAKGGAGDITLYAGGNIYAKSPNGGAAGAVAYGSGNSTITVEGNIVAKGEAIAIGAAIVGYGNIHVGGDVGAYSTGGNATGVEIALGGGNAYVGGNVTAITSGVGYTASGFYANVSTGVGVHIVGDVYAKATDGTAYGAHVIAASSSNVEVDGNVTALSPLGNATGVSIKVTGYHGGYASVGGSVGVYGYQNATGVNVGAQTAQVSVGGNVYVHAHNGEAIGVSVHQYYDSAASTAQVDVTGNVTAISDKADAVGISVHGYYASEYALGNVSVGGTVYAHGFTDGLGVYIGSRSLANLDVGGSIVAKGDTGYATAVSLHSIGNQTLTVGGDVYAKGYTSALGAVLYSHSGNITADITGNVTAKTINGDAVGLTATAPDDVDVTIGGNVFAYSKTANAIGVDIHSDSSLYIGGNAVAMAPAGNAVAAELYSSGNGYVTVHQNVYAHGDLNATGVQIKSYDQATVSVGGYVDVTATTGVANGVYTDSKYGNVNIDVGGEVQVGAGAGNAFGVSAFAYGGAYANVTGNVTVIAHDNGVGVLAVGDSYAEATVDGNVSVHAVIGEASGLLVDSTFDSEITVTGSIYAYSRNQLATGADSGSTDASTEVTVGGNVVAVSKYGSAFGVVAAAGYNADVYVTGTVAALSLYGANATGVFAKGGNDVYVGAGNAVAEAAHGNARAVYAYGVHGSTVDVTGDVEAIGLDSAQGVDAESKDGYGNVTIGGNVVAESDGKAVGVRVSAFEDANLHIGGNAVAESYGSYATAIQAFSSGNVNVGVTGYVKAIAATDAYGFYSSGNHVNITVGGDVSAMAGTGGAWGARLSGNYVDMTVTGNVSAYSKNGGDAYGIRALTDFGADVTVDGNVYAKSAAGVGAVGVDALSFYDGDVNITVKGTTEVIGNIADGLFGESLGGGNVTVNAADITIHQYAGNATYQGAGVFTYTTGATNITVHDIYTTGNFTDGVHAGKVGGDNGDTTVTLNQVETTGAYSPGVWVYGTGNATITSGTAYTKGYKSIGLYAVSTDGGVTINSTMVKTLGNSSAGIYAMAGGPVVVTSGTSVTYGNSSDAVVAINSGITPADTVKVYSGNAITHGNFSDGIYAKGYNSTYVKSNLAVTYGNSSDGIFATSENGPVTVLSNMVHTYYTSSTGIDAFSYHGDVGVTGNITLTNGNFSTGIDAESEGGNVSINSTYVRTDGFFSYGIRAYANQNVSITSNTVRTYGTFADGIHAESINGNTTVASTYVYTGGDNAIGIYARSEGGNVLVTSGGVVTAGNYSNGIRAYADDGASTVTSTYVKTTGTDAKGIYAYGFKGASVTSDTVKTFGKYSIGIDVISNDGQAGVTSRYVATHGDYAPGIQVFGYAGATVDNTSIVRTFGYKSDGIIATAYEGDVHVTSENVVTYGDYSRGVFAQTPSGNVSVVINNLVDTYGYAATGVYARSYNGNATVSNYGLVETRGSFATGVFAEAYGRANVYNEGEIVTLGADANGAWAQSVGADTLAEVENVGDIISHGGRGIYAQSLGGYAEVFNHGYVFGQHGGVVVDSSEGAYVYNDGMIKGGAGFAIGGYGAGSVYVENQGAVFGYALLYTSNNIVDNHGHWFAYGDSYFGYGNDTFNNHGTVSVAPFSTSPTTVTWSGLTVFNNSGLVDLRNGHTGDIFNLFGNGGAGTTWNGLAGSTLAVDATLNVSLTSDRMNIGAANGSTTVVVDDLTPTLPGSLNFVGTTVVHGTSGSASNFTWAGRTKGFINYELAFFSGPVDWNIVALPSNAAFEMLKAPEMAQDFWRRTGDAWSAREQEVRDSLWGSSPPTRGEGWEMWAQAQIGGETEGRVQDFNVQGFSFTPNLRTSSDWRGFQMGGDEWTSKNWLWGFTGGFLEQNSSFKTDHNSFDITGWNVGAYTGFTSGAFFMNGLIKGDWYDVKANMHTVPALETFSGNTWGVKGEAGFRFGSAHLYFEPLADIAWTTTHLDNANFPAQDTSFTYGNATSARGSIGGRIGGQMGSILPYVGLYAVDAFDGNNKMTMITSGGCPSACMSIEDMRPGTYERADFGFTTTSWNGLEGFLKGEAEFGGKTDGFTGRLGVRWRW